MLGLTTELNELAERLRRVTAIVGDGGSGIVWRADGLIVTNAHVAREGRMRVRLAGGGEYRGEVTERNARRDLAVVRIPASGLEAAVAGDSDSLRPGELVIAVGNPLGMAGAASTGVVQANGHGDWIRADVRLAPGNSGGPLANARGEVIGVNAMIAGGLALAVPSNTVARFLAGAERETPRIGVTLRPVIAAGKAGLLLLGVDRGSPAERAGLLTGDVIVLIERRPVAGLDDLPEALRQADPAGGVVLGVLRGGKPREVTVVLQQERADAA